MMFGSGSSVSEGQGVLEQRQLLAPGRGAAVRPAARPRGSAGAGANVTAQALGPAAATAPSLGHPLSANAAATADAVPLGEFADLGRDPRLVVLARVGAAPVQLGVPGGQGRVRLAEPAQEPLAGARPQVQPDRGDVRA